MKRLKNIAAGSATILIFLFFLIYLIFSGNLVSYIKNIALTSGLSCVPGGVYSSPVNDISIIKSAAAGAFPAGQFTQTDSYSFTFPEQGFNAPYFSDEDSSQTNTENQTFPVSTVTLTPSGSSGYITLRNFMLKDSSTKKPVMDDIFKKALDLGLKGADSGPQVLILHTHATESYNLDGLDHYDKNTSFRTEDITKNVVAVGDVIEEKLKENGISVIHAKDLHDKESYTGAYGRSLATAEKYLKENPTIKVILDVHRDSIITAEGVSYRPVKSINNENAAQAMFIIGTGTAALPNDNWKNNLRFATNVQERLESAYPGLMRPMLLRDSRYNMHLAKGYMLIETGSCGNTLEEAKRAASYVGKAIADELNGILKK